jgi:hypothetical protein
VTNRSGDRFQWGTIVELKPPSAFPTADIRGTWPSSPGEMVQQVQGHQERRRIAGRAVAAVMGSPRVRGVVQEIDRPTRTAQIDFTATGAGGCWTAWVSIDEIREIGQTPTLIYPPQCMGNAWRRGVQLYAQPGSLTPFRSMPAGTPKPTRIERWVAEAQYLVAVLRRLRDPDSRDVIERRLVKLDHLLEHGR